MSINKYRNPQTLILAACILLSPAAAVTLQAQQPRQYTAEDYAAAEKFMAYNMNPLAYQGVVRAEWLQDGRPDGRFWYRAADETGITYMLVDPATGKSASAFDQSKLASALQSASEGKIKDDARHLKITAIDSLSTDEIALTYAGARYRCDLAAAACKLTSPAAKPPLNLSPDKKLGAFIRDWNLWVRNMETGAETQLTTDGVKDYG